MIEGSDLQKQLTRVVGRMTRWGLDPGIARTVSADIHTTAQFPLRWRAEAELWDKKASQALNERHYTTAELWYRQAYYCYRIAEFFYLEDCEDKQTAYRASLRAFDAAVGRERGTHLRRLIVNFKNYNLPALLLLPEAASHNHPVPACLAIYGADGTKEDHFWATMQPLVSRGIAALVADGPGQGWSRRIDGVGAIAEYEQFGSRCIDLLANQPEIDSQRIVAWGSSMGGYYAPRVFAVDKRIKACLVNSALYDVVEGVWDKYPPIQPQLQYNIGARSLAEAREQYRRFDLSEVWHPLDRPFCVYHGADDEMIPPSQAQRMCQEAGGRAELNLYPGAGHNLGNVSIDSHPRMWDWLANYALH